jgi:hypothetical protein
MRVQKTVVAILLLSALLPGCAYTEPQHRSSVSGEWIGTLEETVVRTERGNTFRAFLLRIEEGPDMKSYLGITEWPRAAIIAEPDGSVLTRIAEVDRALVGNRVAVKGVRLLAHLYKPRSAEPFGDLVVHRAGSGLEQLILPDEEIRKID